MEKNVKCGHFCSNARGNAKLMIHFFCLMYVRGVGGLGQKKLIMSLALPRAVLRKWPHLTFFSTFCRVYIFFYKFHQQINRLPKSFYIYLEIETVCIKSVSPKLNQRISIWFAIFAWNSYFICSIHYQNRVIYFVELIHKFS